MQNRHSSQFKKKYSAALQALIGRALTKQDGAKPASLAACEKRLKLKLPRAINVYYQIAGNLPLNTEHNILYAPKDLIKRDGKLVFMEENQAVVFWGLDLNALNQPDPEVFQASNAKQITWYSEELPWSDFIIKVWRWQRGLDS